MISTITIGDVTIHRIVEIEVGSMPALQSLPTLTPERLDANRHWLSPRALDAEDRLTLSFQSYIVRTPQHVVLVDTCNGNDKERPDSHPRWHRRKDLAWLDGLAAVGLTVDDIDVVACTHLHIDHVGWNTSLVDSRWVPTFPRARYLFSRKELDFWTTENARTPIPCIEDSVLPIVDANRCDLITSDHAIDDHLRLVSTPGHTIDHFAVQVGRSGADAVITGDLIHSPLQARYPELSTSIDYDPAQASETRRNFLETYCDTRTLVCFTHFPSPSCGYVRKWDEGFRSESIPDRGEAPDATTWRLQP
jgi:glyoxylase-like metal-dependent hydrolase (beta-lactamase superfamily II)